MSFSFRLPEDDPVCQCKYDEAHDRMDKEDCAFHCDMVEDSASTTVLPAERKPPVSILRTTGTQKSASGIGDRIGR
jgi:hypothetical protein